MLKSKMELKEALELFRQNKEATSKKQDKYSYYKIEEYTELLDRCFGVDGYRVSYSDAQIVTLPFNQTVFLSKAVVQVFDEEEHEVFSFEGYGTYEATLSSEKTNYIMLSTVGMNGCVNALKSACTNIGAFGSRNLDGEKKKPSGNTSGNKGGSSPSGKSTLPTEQVMFYVTKPAVEGGTDRNTGEPMYKLTCNEVVNGSARIHPSEVLFYPNQYKSNGMENLSKILSVEKPFRLALKVSKVNGNTKEGIYATYAFKGWAV